jgi:hypothetical protein
MHANRGIHNLEKIQSLPRAATLFKPASTITMASVASFASFLVSKTSTDSENKPSEGELIATNSKLRKQVTVLEAENAKLKAENAQLKKRKATSSVVSTDTDTSSAPAAKKRKTSTDASAGGPTTQKLKTPGQCKKLFDKWSKAAMRESSKHKIVNGGYGGELYTVTVKETTPWMVADFQAMFAGQGVKIQPTPGNKPTSQITILDFGTFGNIEKLFAECGGSASIAQDGYKAQSWRSRSFSKSYRNGDLGAELQKLQVHFNKSKLSVHLLFTFGTTDMDY